MSNDKIQLYGGINAVAFFASAFTADSYPIMWLPFIVTGVLVLWFGWQCALIFLRGIGSVIQNPNFLDENYIKSLTIMFETMGFLAKSDGQFSAEEARFSLHFMSNFIPGLDGTGHGQKLIEAFERGRSFTSYQEKVIEFSRLNKTNPKMKKGFINGLIGMAFIDGYLNAEEKKIIENISSLLFVYSPEELNRIFDSYCGKKAEPVSNDAVAEAYKIFQCQQTDSYLSLKQKYNILCRQHHPDAVGTNQNVEEMKKINNAWNTIKSHMQSQKKAS